MKPPLPIALPPPGSRSRLPFLLVPVLAGLAVVQLTLPQRIDLPPGGSVARVGLAPLPAPPPVVIVPPLLASRDLFAPPARRGGPDSAGDPLDGAVIAGVVQQGRRRLGVVQQASGHVRYVSVGGDVAGWRLVALDQAEARLTHGPGQNLTVAYGLHPSSPGTAGTPPLAFTRPMTRPAPAAPARPIGNFVSPQTFESGQ